MLTASDSMTAFAGRAIARQMSTDQQYDFCRLALILAKSIRESLWLRMEHECAKDAVAELRNALLQPGKLVAVLRMNGVGI
jgi:hypothetical protein